MSYNWSAIGYLYKDRSDTTNKKVVNTVHPIKTPVEVQNNRLAICLDKCQRKPDQMCVLACCGARPLSIITSWATHNCPKKYWESIVKIGI